MAHGGKAFSKPSHGMMIKYIIITTITRLIKSSQNPHLTISATVTRSLPKMTVLGPVPAGIINPRDDATAAGIINNSGLIAAATAILANTGSKILAVAVLELNSVNIMTNPITRTMTIKN